MAKGYDWHCMFSLINQQHGSCTGDSNYDGNDDDNTVEQGHVQGHGHGHGHGHGQNPMTIMFNDDNTCVCKPGVHCSCV